MNDISDATSVEFLIQNNRRLQDKMKLWILKKWTRKTVENFNFHYVTVSYCNCIMYWYHREQYDGVYKKKCANKISLWEKLNKHFEEITCLDKNPYVSWNHDVNWVYRLRKIDVFSDQYEKIWLF